MSWVGPTPRTQLKSRSWKDIPTAPRSDDLVQEDPPGFVWRGQVLGEP
jgi:hypothetical protein